QLLQLRPRRAFNSSAQHISFSYKKHTKLSGSPNIALAPVNIEIGFKDSTELPKQT
ncbi:16377_t:CDS:2, partial [Dentiscutata erythropus]